MAGERLGRAREHAREWASRLRAVAFKLPSPAEITGADAILALRFPRASAGPTTMRDDYIQSALKVIDDPNILVNVVSLRVKQLKRGNRPLIESLEKLSAEDTALREIAEGKISYELATAAELARSHGQ